jgi:hypothetical protein
MNKGPWDDTFPSPEALERIRTFPAADLAPYAGMHVLFSWDGSRILAAAQTRELLWEHIRTAGLDSNRVIWDYVDRPDEVCL